MSSRVQHEIVKAARRRESEIVDFLRDIVGIPSMSGDEGRVVARIREEMESAGFDEVLVDGLGNVRGRVGDGPRVIAFDAHVDTVDVGERQLWTCDPFAGRLTEDDVFGRGTADQKGGLAAMIHAGRLIKEMGLADRCQVWFVGSVMEEDCDGLCWHYILKEGVLRPEVVVSTEPTSLRLYRGQRGRMEIRVTARGLSCHGSAPERGDNAVTKLAPVVPAIAALNDRLASDPFLGKGTCAVTWFGSQSPSLCAVPDKAELHIDRRLTAGETRESALAEVVKAVADAGVEAEVTVPSYETPSWRGLSYPMEKYYPTWLLEPDHHAVQAHLDKV